MCRGRQKNRWPSCSTSWPPCARLRRVVPGILPSPSRPLPPIRSKKPTRSPMPSSGATWRHCEEELGDLLLQVVYHARMAEEAGAFAFADVVERSRRRCCADTRTCSAARQSARRVRRPDSGNASRDAGKGAREQAAAGVLADVPVGLPALTRAVKLQQKAARVGFDWPSRRRCSTSSRRSSTSWKRALAAPSATPRAPGGRGPRRSATSCSSSPTWRVTSSSSPRRCCGRPTPSSRRRFAGIEQQVGERPAEPRSNPTLAEMDRLWDQAKAEEARLKKTRQGPRQPSARPLRAPDPHLRS